MNISEHDSKTKRILASSKLPILLALLAIVLTLPALSVGLQLDDFVHKVKLLGQDISPVEDASLFGLFSFLDGNADRTRELMDMGFLPWWTFENIKIAFWRPLTEVFHYIDYALWPNSPMFMHAHSLLWFGLLVFCVTIFYRRMIPVTWIAGLASLLYAIDNAHGVPVGWLANRNALLATTFGLITLILHDRWRRNQSQLSLVIAPLCLALALLSSEAAIATCAYLFAYAICIEPKNKLISLAPYALVVLAWWIVYQAFGYGTWGSDFYLDPGDEPWLYLQALVERVPVLLASQWGPLPAGIYHMLPKPSIFVLASMAFVIAITLILYPALKGYRNTHFWFVGMMLSILPVCAVGPDERLLFFVGLGGMGLLAEFLGLWWSKSDTLPQWKPWRWLARLTVWFFVATHLIFAPLTLPATTWSIRSSADPLINNPIDQLPFDQANHLNTMILIDPPIGFFAVQIPLKVAIEISPVVVPKHTHILASGTKAKTLWRIDSKTLDIEIEGGFFANSIDRIFRGKTHSINDKVEVSNMTAEVLSTTVDGRPEKVRFTFDHSLDSDDFLIYRWHKGKFVPYKLPKPGTSVTLKYRD
jgi:hypothetical protein